MTPQRPANLQELSVNLFERVERAKSAKVNYVFIERTELESILTGDFIPTENADDSDVINFMTANLSEGQLRLLDEVSLRSDDTRPNNPLVAQITTAEQFVQSLDLEAATEECKEPT